LGPYNDQYVRAESVPSRKEQRQYPLGEGPCLVGKNDLIRVDQDEAFNYLRAQIVFERIEKDFLQIKGFVPIDRGIIFISEHLSKQKRRNVVEKVFGAYPSHRIFFCMTVSISKEAFFSVQEALLYRHEIPTSYWELVDSNKDDKIDRFPVLKVA